MVAVREKRPSVGTRVAGLERGGRGEEPQRRVRFWVIGGVGVGVVEGFVGGGVVDEGALEKGNFGRDGFRLYWGEGGMAGPLGELADSGGVEGGDAVVVLVRTRKWSDILVSV